MLIRRHQWTNQPQQISSMTTTMSLQKLLARNQPLTTTSSLLKLLVQNRSLNRFRILHPLLRKLSSMFLQWMLTVGFRSYKTIHTWASLRMISSWDRTSLISKWFGHFPCISHTIFLYIKVAWPFWWWGWPTRSCCIIQEFWITYRSKWRRQVPWVGPISPSSINCKFT